MTFAGFLLECQLAAPDVGVWLTYGVSSSVRAPRAASSSSPSATRVMTAPGRIVRPSRAMRLLASASRSAWRMRIRLPNRLAIWTKRAAGRAWSPAGSMTVRFRSAIGQSFGSLVIVAADSAAAATSSSDAPTLAWTPATNAPSTSGASGTRTAARSISVRSSRASSTLSAALPKSKRSTAPSDEAGSGPRIVLIASVIRTAFVPRRPSSVPPASSTRTSSPPNWATMSRRPSTSVRLCDTRTRPTNHASFPLQSGWTGWRPDRRPGLVKNKARNDVDARWIRLGADSAADPPLPVAGSAVYTRSIETRPGFAVSLPSPSRARGQPLDAEVPLNAELPLNAPRLRAGLVRVRRAVDRHAAYLTRLDAVLGDGDHGDNLSTGFRAVEELLAELPDETPPGELLRAVGHRLV